MLNIKKNQEKVQGPAQLPFWDDEQDYERYSQTPIKSKSFTALIKIYRVLVVGFIWMNFLGFTIYLLWKLLGAIAAYAFIAFMLLSIARVIIWRKQTLALAEKKRQIQALARQTTGAEVIGSAVHVAGHPLFERDQPVVLALKGTELSIHTYQSSVPVDVLRMGDIKAIHTVVYDDERVPHIDVIDSTAQALQVTVTTNGKEYTCLFRRLRNVRAIDWYHAVQKAKVS